MGNKQEKFQFINKQSSFDLNKTNHELLMDKNNNDDPATEDEEEEEESETDHCEFPQLPTSKPLGEPVIKLKHVSKGNKTNLFCCLVNFPKVL
jgi:hypothetical protein